MITKLDTKELMTREEAFMKYAKHYFGMAVTKQDLNNPYNDLGYVIYLMDTREETFKIQRKTDEGLYISTMPGYAVGGTEIGGYSFD